MKKTKQKREKKEKKEDRINTLKEFGSTYKYQYSPVAIDLVENAAWCAKVTASACWRPDIYLDNDKSCDECRLHPNCLCPLKNFKKKQNKI